MDILEELKQDAHQARMLALWTKFRIPFFLILLAIVLGSGIYAWRTHHHQKEIDAASTTYGQSLILEEKGQISQSIITLSQLSTLKLQGFRTLSLLFLGDILSATNRPLAKEKYAAISQDSSISKAFRYLALLKSLLLDFSSEKSEETFLEPLYELQHTTTPSSAWARFSQEMEALHNFNQNKLEKAHSLYSLIVQNPKALTSQKGRALRMLMIIESHPQYRKPSLA